MWPEYMDFGDIPKPPRGDISKPPRPPAGPPQDLSRVLLDAVLRGDADEARRVFDCAFWEKEALKPDGYHLIQAAQRGDRDMVRLLTAYGATWTEDEAKLAKAIVKPDKWQHVEGPLRNAGIRTQFAAQELKTLDLMTAVAWGARSVADAKARGLKDTDAAAQRLDDIIAAGLVDAVLQGDMGKARALLLYRNPKLGDGRAEFPLDVGREVNVILSVAPRGGGRLALKFLDALRAEKLALRPVALKSLEVIAAPELAPELEKRGLLAQEQPQARSEVIGVWTALQERIDFNGSVLELPAEEVEKRRAEMHRIAGILFGKGRPVTDGEAEAFASLHESRLKIAPHALAAAEKDLLEMGFFDGPAWTAQRLKRLAAEPLPDASVTAAFNARALRREAAAFIGKPVTPASLAAALAAHRAGAWQANAQATEKIVEFLAARVKKDQVPEDVADALKTLAAGGADFSAVRPEQYLGRHAPGLGKALLDAGAVAAESFDLEAVSKKYGGQINLVTPPGRKNYEATEFICQLILEIAEPHKYAKLRGEKDVSYQKLFMKEWVENLSRRRGGTITYRRHFPGTGSTGPR